MNAQDLSLINIKSCRGCMHANYKEDELIDKIKKAVDEASLEERIKANAKSHFLYHHPFDITLARCPNSCSRPQLADISIVAINTPVLTEIPCIKCNRCIRECKENAIVYGENRPIIDYNKCIGCGDCFRVCPTSTISSSETEFIFAVGGKLGRHPRFAMEMGRTNSVDIIIDWTDKTIKFYKENMKGEERFSVTLDRYGINNYKKSVLGLEE